MYSLFAHKLALKKEAKKKGRGTMRFVVNNEYGLTAIGWVDGNTVYFLTSADGTGVDAVKRRVKSEKKIVKAPEATKKFNKRMQGVD